MTTLQEVFYCYCPRCDKRFQSTNQKTACDLVRAHILRQMDDLHADLIEEWDDDV